MFFWVLLALWFPSQSQVIQVLFCCNHLCLLLTFILKLEKVRNDGGLWLFYSRETRALIKPESMSNSYQVFVVSQWGKSCVFMKMKCEACAVNETLGEQETHGHSTVRFKRHPKCHFTEMFKVTNKSSRSWHGEDFNFKSRTYLLARLHVSSQLRSSFFL